MLKVCYDFLSVLVENPKTTFALAIGSRKKYDALQALAPAYKFTDDALVNSFAYAVCRLDGSLANRIQAKSPQVTIDAVFDEAKATGRTNNNDNRKKRTCKYCKKPGHVEMECRTKIHNKKNDVAGPGK